MRDEYNNNESMTLKQKILKPSQVINLVFAEPASITDPLKEFPSSCILHYYC